MPEIPYMLFSTILAVMLVAHSLSIDTQEAGVLEVKVRFEAPLIKYYIHINQSRASAEFEIKIPNAFAICSSYYGVRTQLVSVSTYIVRIDPGSSGVVVCATSSSVNIYNSSVEASIPPILINGNAATIEEVWLPYYIVNISSTPSYTGISIPGGDGYVLTFNTTDTIYIAGRIIPLPRIQAQQQGESGDKASDPVDDMLYQITLLAIGLLVGSLSVRLLPIIRSKLERRNVEKEIIELLSKNPRGMSLSMISKTLNTPKSSIWKKLRKLINEGVVEEFEGPGRGKLYRLKRKEETPQ